jgi:hypothetical protein
MAAESKTSQYAELGEDDLITLLFDKYFGSDNSELSDLVGMLMIRREASASARRRIGEYLRQQGIVETRYREELESISEYTRTHARAPKDELDVIREDPYAPGVALKLSDLSRVVQPAVRDTKAEFFVEQERRLEILLERYGRTMPEKQQNILRCIAHGHYSYRSSGWSSSGYTHSSQGNGEDCGDRGNGNTMNALMNRKLTTYRSRVGVTDSTMLMLAEPKIA